MLNTNAESKSRNTEIKNADAVKALVDVVTKAMTTDNIDDMVNCFAADSEWVIMATGETFKGLDKIRELATRSVAARKHTDQWGIKPFNVFTDAAGTRLCWEYLHTGWSGLVRDAVRRRRESGDPDLSRWHHLDNAGLGVGVLPLRSGLVWNLVCGGRDTWHNRHLA